MMEVKTRSMAEFTQAVQFRSFPLIGILSNQIIYLPRIGQNIRIGLPVQDCHAGPVMQDLTRKKSDLIKG
jgi:hypothetical protein